MRTLLWLKELASHLPYENVKVKVNEGAYTMRFTATNRHMDLVFFPSRLGGFDPMIRPFISLYDVMSILEPHLVQSRRKPENKFEHTLIKTLKFPVLNIEYREKENFSENFIKKFNHELEEQIMEPLFLKYKSGADVGLDRPGPYTYKEIAWNHWDTFFKDPFFEIYLTCKCLAGIPDFPEELNLYEEMIDSLPPGYRHYLGEGKFEGYKRPVGINEKELIARLRSIFEETKK